MKKKLPVIMTIAVAAVLALILPMAGNMRAYAYVQDQSPAILVILGDSIGTGYGTSGYNASQVQNQTNVFGYAKVLRDTKGYDVRNRAVDGAQTINVIDRLENHEATRADVAVADIVNITIGGNDLRDINTIFGSSRFMSDVIAECKAGTTEKADLVLEYMRGNIERILELIYQLNPDALVTVFENYTPAFYAANALERILIFNIVFGTSDHLGLDLAGETIITRLNSEVWTECAANYPGTMVLSDAYNEMMINAADVHTGQTIRSLFQFDFIHPTDAGHLKLAKILMETIDSTIKTVEVSSYVVKLVGNQNELSITVTESYFDKTTEVFEVTILIDNNAKGIYEVGPYNVFVDTKGNIQVRDCFLVA